MTLKKRNFTITLVSHDFKKKLLKLPFYYQGACVFQVNCLRGSSRKTIRDVIGFQGVVHLFLEYPYEFIIQPERISLVGV